LSGEASTSRGVAEATGSNVGVARASRVSMGITVGVKTVSEGVTSIDVERGVTVVWTGRLQAVNARHKTRTISKRRFIHSSFSKKILIPHLDYRNSSLGQNDSCAFQPATVF
jgi:hypothetical protein